MIPLVGLTGPQGSGKTTVAGFLVSAFGWKAISLADPIRAGLQAMFGMYGHEFEDRVLKDHPIGWHGKTPRELMQSLGTEWGRKMVSETIWIDLAQHEIELSLRLHKDYRGLAVSDVRFANEADWIRGMGGTIWHLHDRIFDRIGPANRQDAHESEDGVRFASGDKIVDNSGTMDDLYDQVLLLQRELR